MNDLPTPEELGDKLKAGEITKEEAIEIMSERARRDAFSAMYGGSASGEGTGGEAGGGVKAVGFWVLGWILLLLVLLFVLVRMIGS